MLRFGLELFKLTYFHVIIKPGYCYPVTFADIAFILVSEKPFHKCGFIHYGYLFDVPAQYGALSVPIGEPSLDLINTLINGTVGLNIDNVLRKCFPDGIDFLVNPCLKVIPDDVFQKIVCPGNPMTFAIIPYSDRSSPSFRKADGVKASSFLFENA